MLTVDDLAKMFEREHNSTTSERQERDRQLIQFCKVIDCRYFDTLRNLRNRFKEHYSCSQEQCPIIRERMEHHMLQRHSSAKPTRPDPKLMGGIIGTGLSGMNSRTPSGHRITGRTRPSTHTLLAPIGTYREHLNTDYFKDKAVSYTGASVKVLDTNIEDTLKTELKYDLVNLFENVPLNPENKEAMLTTLADDISKIIVNDYLDTDGKIKAEIDKAVNKLLRNHPASKLDNFELVGDVRARLFDIVKDKQQDIIQKGDRNADDVSAYNNVSNMYDENYEDVPTELSDSIKKLFENYPIHTGTKLNKEAKDNLLHRLIDDINQIAKNKTMTESDKKAEIEKILDDLNLKYPESTDRQGKNNYKNEIQDKLFDFIDDEPKDLTDSIKKLFKSYPIHTRTKSSKEVKDNLLNNLIDDINRIARDTTMTDADKKAKIDNILEDLHSKYPESMDIQEKEKHKHQMRDKLFDLVKVKPKDFTNPIKKLLENYPIHTGTKLSKEAKENLVNNLIVDINQIAKNTTIANAEKKAAIENILDDFYTKYPEPTEGEIKQMYKNEIRDKLFDLIKAEPKGSKKKWEELNDLSGPSGTGGKAGGTSGKKIVSKISRFETVGSRSLVGGKNNTSFGGSNNNKMVGVSTGSGVGMNSKKIGNRTTNRLYGGSSDNNASWVGSSGVRGVNSDANNTGTIGNGIGPNDGVFGGYSGTIDNRPLAINDRNDNRTANDNLSQEVTQFFEDHPIFNQSPQSQGTKENILRHLVEDVNKIAANNKLNDDDVANEVDELVQRLRVRYPAHKSIQTQYKNEIRDKLYDMISNARDNDIGNRRTGRRDRNNEAGPSTKRPRSPEYDFKQSLNRALEDIAIYPQNKDAHRDSVINNLFDDISWIADSIKPGNDNVLNREIECALDRLHLWYPGAKRDQTEYKNDIRDRIFNVIKEYNKFKPKRPPKNDINESIISDSSDDSNSYNNRRDLRTIKYWVSQLKHEKFMQGVDTNELVKKLINRIVPILKSNNCCGKVTILKGAVLEIMSEIPTTANCNNKLQRMVNDLVNNLYCRYKNDCCSSAGSRRQTLYVDTVKNMWISNKLKKLNEFLDDNNIAQNHDVRNEIGYLIMAVNEKSVETLVERESENDINKVQEDKTNNVSASEVTKTYKNITKICSNSDGDSANSDDGTYLNGIYKKDISVYTSMTSCCATSTPKKTASRDVQKLNNEEIKYINDLSNFIRAWMETLPVQFNAREEMCFKDAMIAELAGEIMDIAKIAQITPHTKEELDGYHLYLVYKWIKKLNVCELKCVGPQVEDFMKRLEDIPVPVLTTPHQGTRQAMDNIKVREEQGWDKDFLPKGIDVLEDEISIWINEQPSDMFNFNRESRNNKIHTLAQTIQNKLKNKSLESEINHDIEQWLNDNVRMDKYANINEVKDTLKDRIIKVPGDATIFANYEEQQRERSAKIELIEKQKNEPKEAKIDEDTMDIERTMKDFIVKFVDHHYDVDDPLAIRTFNYLLKRQLQRINPKDSCQGPCSYKEALSPQKLYEELELVKTVSDWLKNIPIYEGYHKVGNRERIDLVLDLTKTIKAIEDERERVPCAMDYDLYLSTTLHSYFCNIPIIEEYATPKDHATMLLQILHRIVVWRELIAKKRMENSLDTSGINDENIGDFIEEFIRHHGTEIANDEVKMEAWSIRLLREVKIIVRNSPDPKIVTKSQVYNKLATVPIPSDDTVERFDRELVYIEEITEWMKNLPLLSIDGENEQKRGEEEENRRIMLCDLAETMAVKENLADDSEFKEYLTKWIQDLPLDLTNEINIPFLIDQLIRRIGRTMKDNDVGPIVNTTTDRKCSTVVPKSSSRYRNSLKSLSKQAKNPGTKATDAIEKWSQSLPINLDEAAQGSIERKLLKKVSEFNSDPIAFHDDLLYQTFLTVEIDEVLEKLPGGIELQTTMEQKNKELVKSLVDARKMAKENGAGDDYKHRLERTLDASIPSPVTPKQVFDPAFEIYKTRLAEMFILDNFDHSNDDVKMKYERQIRNEIDKYFNSVAKRNATRLTNHEIYNELYSALFKVPIPNENAVKEEVEQIKTRCVIDAWVETLPLINNENFYEQLELDKKVETLAKRIHEIEKLPKSDEKLTKKISQWLTNVSLRPGEEGNIQKYTDLLKKELKASTRQRKCSVDKGAKSKKGKGKSKQKKTKHDGSQIPGSNDNFQSPTTVQPTKAADLIVDIVEQWSNTVPLSAHDNIDVEIIRNDVVRKVLIKISDFNSNSDIFNNNFIYKDYLDEELDKILREIPKCCDFEPNVKTQIKSNLIEAVIALKPLVRKERVRFNYVHDLNNTVDRMLERPDNLADDKVLEYEALKEDIVENFVQIHYYKNDLEGRQEHKAKVHDDVVTFLNDIAGEKNHNPQIRMNQLLTELAKVPVPNNEVLKEEVAVVKMKNEINEFFDVNNVKQPKDKSLSIDAIKSSLARKLANIEKGDYNIENDDKMKNEITKSLKKLNKELKPRTIEGFVNKLKANESTRKRKFTKDDTVCEESCNMLKYKEKIKDQISCDNTCPHAAKKPKPCDNATCSNNNNVKDTTKDNTCHYMAKAPIPCDETTCNNNVLKNTTADNTCENTCSQTAKVLTPCDDSTCSNKILEETTTANICDSTCQDNLKTETIDRTCNNSCSHDDKKLQTDPIDSQSIQTQNYECNDCEDEDGETESDENEDENADLLAERPEEKEICPCERRMRDMWRYYMSAARWRCEGPEDPFCRDPSARREMAPTGTMMARFRR